MTVALIGGADFVESSTIGAELLELSGASSVLVLPIASAFEHPDRLVARATAYLTPRGATVTTVPIMRRADAMNADLVAQVAAARFVYLTDGSPMHLRSVVKDTPLWDALCRVEESGLVAASGAAAMLVTDPMLDVRGGAFTLGLGMVSPLAVLPAHETWSPERSRRNRELAPAHVPVVSLDTDAAIVNDAAAGGRGVWRTLGSGQVTVHIDGAASSLAALPG
ncbi:MAG: hypothetical protein AB7V43_22100 [Acidimicrobiia bacterium]